MLQGLKCQAMDQDCVELWEIMRYNTIVKEIMDIICTMLIKL